METLRTVWVGASGSATGFGIIRSIRDHWGDEVRIVALDTNPPALNASSVFADDYRQVPAVADAGYDAALEALIERVSGPTIYFPVYDAEILHAARRAEAGALPPALTILTAGDARAVGACNDKLAAFETLVAAGLPAAATTPLSAARFAGAPMVVKARHGVASTPQYVEREAELHECQRRLDVDDTVAQERCLLPEVTIDAFIGRPGGPNAAVRQVLCRERLETKAGVVTKARVFADAELSRLATGVASAFRLAGAICLQVMRSRADGGWRVTDVNPRPGGGTRMSAAAGWDFVVATLVDVLGGAAEFPPIALPQTVVRQHAEFVTTRSRVAGGA
jgi:carbamoylphosphate synthase large subunit